MRSPKRVTVYIPVGLQAQTVDRLYDAKEKLLTYKPTISDVVDAGLMALNFVDIAEIFSRIRRIRKRERSETLEKIRKKT